MTFSLRQTKTPADVLSFTRMPSESSCQQMKQLLIEGKYSAINCESGAFTLESIEVLLKIHSLRNVKNAVRKEQQWLKKEVQLPDQACSYSKEHLSSYADKIFNTPNHHSPLSSNRFILASDLANIAGTGWLDFSIITGVAEILNRDGEETAALLLNNVVMVDEQDLHEYVKRNIRHGVKYVVLFSNVGKTKKNDVFISNPGNPGNHWTLLYVDLTVNKWYYCYTYCWGMPEYLKSSVTLFVTAIYQYHGKTPKPVSGIIQAHTESLGSSHSCAKMCLKNIPTQTCPNVCGAAAAVLGGIACAVPGLWINMFVNQNIDLPASLRWLLFPTVHSDFLRCSLISWLLADSIDVSLLGISREWGEPTQRRRYVPFSPRVLDNVVISDNESEKEDKDDDGWTKVQYGKKKKKANSQQRKGNLHKEGEGVAASPGNYCRKDGVDVNETFY